jgi:hypothetical protein
MSPASISDVDALAISMVLILALSFGVVALLILSITRHGKRRDHEVEDLLEEVRRDQEAAKLPAPSAGSAAETREAWEKEGDWWKK